MPRSNKNRPPDKRIRVRSKRLEEIDSTKLALAVWLMAQNIVEDQTRQTKTDRLADDAPSPTEPDAEAA